MRLIAQILAGLGRATQGLSQEPTTEGQITVPPVLQPVIAVPLEWVPQIVDTNANQRTSCGNAIVIQVANGAQTGLSVMTLGRGLWRLNIDADYSSNYDGGAAITGFVRLIDPGGLFLTQMLAFQAATGAFQHDHHDLIADFLLPSDGWVLQGFLAGNGVGQSHRVVVSVVAMKFI